MTCETERAIARRIAAHQNRLVEGKDSRTKKRLIVHQGRIMSLRDQVAARQEPKFSWREPLKFLRDSTSVTEGVKMVLWTLALIAFGIWLWWSTTEAARKFLHLWFYPHQAFRPDTLGVCGMILKTGMVGAAIGFARVGVKQYRYPSVWVPSLVIVGGSLSLFSMVATAAAIKFRLLSVDKVMGTVADMLNRHMYNGF